MRLAKLFIANILFLLVFLFFITYRAPSAFAGSAPWMQGQGLDFRLDGSYTNSILGNGCNSTSSSEKYLSAPLEPTSGFSSPGVVFMSGGGSLGPGQASKTTPPNPPYLVGTTWNWFATDEKFQPTQLNSTHTSYNYLLSLAQASGTTTYDMSTACSPLANCGLGPNLLSGVYTSTGNVTLVSEDTNTFTTGTNFIFLIKGDLTIKTSVIVPRVVAPQKKFVLFAASGNILIDKRVGDANADCSGTETSPFQPLEGIYSADNSITIDGSNKSSGCVAAVTDNVLNVHGTLIANAALTATPGTITNNRCSTAPYPSVFIYPRLDFITNTPEFLKQQVVIRQEIAP